MSTTLTQPILDISGNEVTVVNPTIITEDKMSISILGQNTSEISVAINNNFISLMQSFYGPTPPINPLMGQEWLNSEDDLKYMWKGENWVQNSPDSIFDCFLYIKYDLDETEFVIDETSFNFTIENIKMYNQDFKDTKFIIDPFDSKKIILKEANIQTLYIMIFHPKDRITNPTLNKRIEMFSESGQTQYDIESFIDGSETSNLSVTLNDVMLKNNEFSVSNNILTIDGMIYRVKENDVITVWSKGGSLSSYYTTLHIHTNKRLNNIKIPKFFKSLLHIELIDVDTKTTINPIAHTEEALYFYFEFLNEKKVASTAKVRII